MKVSIIVSTYNGAKKIRRILEALLRQTFKDFEIVIAVDGSVDNTEEVVSEMSIHFPHLKVVNQKNRGRASIRNFGASHARGEIFIFFDDDMAPHDNCVEKHLQFHVKTKTASVLAGNIIEPSEGKSDIQLYKSYLAVKWTEKYQDGLSQLSQNNLFLSAANFSIDANIFRTLKGFDERLKDIEDFEFGCRILKNGIPLFFDKSNLALHYDLISAQSYLNRLTQYANALKTVKRLVPDLPITPRKVSTFQKLQYWPFSFSFLIQMMEKNVFKTLPRQIRFKLYDKILYAQSNVYV
jgi:glycosyltransferase involved in cell wall biosynthesis